MFIGVSGLLLLFVFLTSVCMCAGVFGYPDGTESGAHQ